MTNIEAFTELLTIKKHALDDELVVHSDVLFRIGDQITKLRERVAAATDDFKKTEAEAFEAQKQMVDGSTGKPLSDTRAEMAARGDVHRNRAWTVMTGAKADLERWEVLYEAWKAKGFNMNTLSGLYQTGNFSVGLPNRAGNKRDYTEDPPPASTRRRAQT